MEPAPWGFSWDYIVFFSNSIIIKVDSLNSIQTHLIHMRIYPIHKRTHAYIVRTYSVLAYHQKTVESVMHACAFGI